MADRHRLRIGAAKITAHGKNLVFACEKPGCDVRGKVTAWPHGIADDLYEAAARWHNDPIDGGRT